MKLLDSHIKSLTTAATLTGFQVMDPISPLEVIKILNSQRISFILVGAYGLVGWIQEPRATKDVHVIIAARQHKKALKPHTAAADPR